MDKFSPVPHDRAFVNRALKKRGVKAAYDALEEEYTLAAELLRARKKAGLTQSEVARRMGTKRPAVARIESAKSGHSPSVNTLRKYADAVGRKLKITLAA